MMILRNQKRIYSSTAIKILVSAVLVLFSVKHISADEIGSPDHVLTYTSGRLTWDPETETDERNGSAELCFFENSYRNVTSDNKESVIAPGTEKDSVIRLNNSSDHPAEYVAVLYYDKSSELLPVFPQLQDDENYTDMETEEVIPEGVAENQIVRRVAGTIDAGESQDFTVTWFWHYFEDELRDLTDTELGNMAVHADAEEIMAGFYIVIREDAGVQNSDDSYVLPQTGVYFDVSGYLYLLFVCVAAAVFVLGRKEQR